LGTNTKSTNLRIHELVIFNQTMKIDAHEEKYFHSSFIQGRHGHMVVGFTAPVQSMVRCTW
jgi:hypothetical protein